jgi:hypothetical protein
MRVVTSNCADGQKGAMKRRATGRKSLLALSRVVGAVTSLAIAKWSLTLALSRCACSGAQPGAALSQRAAPASYHDPITLCGGQRYQADTANQFAGRALLLLVKVRALRVIPRRKLKRWFASPKL